MRKESKNFFGIFTRYLILILIGIPNLWLFYLIFTPLTIYPVFFLLNLFFDASLFGNLILLNKSFSIEIINACVAGSAYYLLLILNLSIPMKINKRLKILVYFFIILIITTNPKIFLLSRVCVSGTSLFDII